jgi:hypothetical protein
MSIGNSRFSSPEDFFSKHINQQYQPPILIFLTSQWLSFEQNEQGILVMNWL